MHCLLYHSPEGKRDFLLVLGLRGATCGTNLVWDDLVASLSPKEKILQVHLKAGFSVENLVEV